MDGGSCIAATSSYLRWHNKECYALLKGEVSPAVSWMFSEEDFCKGPVDEDVDILQEARSMVVFDCQPEPDRLGFDVPSGIEQVIVFDHHASSADKHNPERGVFVDILPSAGCVLMNHGIVHPILYVGLWADTVGFKYNTLRAAHYLKFLRGRCDQDPYVGGCEIELTDELIQEYHTKMFPKVSTDLLSVMKSAPIRHCRMGDVDVTLVGVNTRSGEVASQVLEVVGRTADVYGVVNKTSGKVSLRSRDPEKVTVNNIAEKFKGGGHKGAAGCKIADGFVSASNFADFVSFVIHDVGRQIDSEPGYITYA